MDPWANISHLTKEQTISLQEDSLHKFINHYLYPFSAHYRQLFDAHHIDPKSIRTLQDLARIPFASKSDFMGGAGQENKFMDFILQPDEQTIKQFWPARKLLSLAYSKTLKGREYLTRQMDEEFRPVFMTFTTGTTSKPISFLYSNYDIKNLHISGARMLSLFEIHKDEKIVNMFPYAPHLAFWQVVYGGLASCSLVLSTGGGKVMGTEGNIAALLKMKPSVVLGVPSYVYHLMRVAQEKGVRMDFIKTVVLGASRVTMGFKNKLAQLLMSMGAGDVAVLGTYGFTEARCAWAECPTSLDVSSGYHLYSDKEIIEIIDPDTGEVKGEGEDGEIVYTSLDSRASSVIRYRTGDFVHGGMTYEPCPHCGRSGMRISSDITRLSDVKDLQLSKIKGALVNLNHFAAILADIDMIDEWQIEIRKKHNDPYEIDELIVYVCPNKGCNKEELTTLIKKEMLSITEVTPNAVEYLQHKDIIARLELETANKAKRIIDCRPKD